MAKKQGRTTSCDAADADARLKQAREFAELATIDRSSPDGPKGSAAVSTAILAAIAAPDSICCRSLGVRSNDDDHGRAVELLEQAGKVGTAAAKHLQDLLRVKNKASYSSSDPTVSEAKRAIRAMEDIIALAENL